MKRRTVSCLECEAEKRLRLEFNYRSTSSNSSLYTNAYMVACNTPIESIIKAALNASAHVYDPSQPATTVPKKISQNVFAAYFISQFLKALNVDQSKTAFIPCKLVPYTSRLTAVALPVITNYAAQYNQNSYYEHCRRFTLYNTHFVDDTWVLHLIKRDLSRFQYNNVPAINVTKEQLKKIFNPLIKTILPFDLVSPTFPNYLLLDAVALLRQSICAFSHENGLPPKEKLFLSILLQFNYLEILNHRNALYFLILLIASCLLLSCDLSEFSDSEINGAIFHRFYRVAQSIRSQNANSSLTPEKSLISRELRQSRLLICKTLNWDINVGGIRQWLELLVTRMAVRENQQLNVFWISLYYDAELTACETKFCMNYIFDWSSTHYQAAVQCLVHAILKRSDFESLLHLLNSVTAELADIQSA